MTTTETTIVCVRCSADVTGPVDSPTGQKHAGHVDERLDTTCGTWGFRAKRANEYEDAR